MCEEVYVWSKADIVNRGQEDTLYVHKGDFLELEESFVDAERRLDVALANGKEMLQTLKAAKALWEEHFPADNSNALEAMKLVDAAIAKAELTDEGPHYRFPTGPYEVELSTTQWTAVHGIFENYNESPSPEEQFSCAEDSVNGLVSEVLVALDLAPPSE